MAAIPAFQPGRAVVQGTAIQIPENDLLEIGAVESVLTFKLFLVNLNKGFKRIFHTPVIIRRLRIPGA